MEVNQIYEFVNNATSEALGGVDIDDAPTLSEDMSNIVDMGNEIENLHKVDNYVRSLVNHIGKVIFVNRPYAGSAPSVYMDSWEYGSIVEKISSFMPEATINETWELEDGREYNPNIFNQPKAKAKFFNDRITFEIDRSFTSRQVKESFSNVTQMNAFLSMLYNEVEKSLTVKTDDLIMRTINTMTAKTLTASDVGIKAINLLSEYNTTTTETLTASECVLNPDFIRFAAFKIGIYADRMKKISTLFNVGKMPRFTPRDKLKIIMLSEFEMAANVFLQSDVYHNELTRLPMAEAVPFWQVPGSDYSFNNTSSINLTLDGQRVSQSGIICVMFDRDALGVTNLDRRVLSYFNAKAEFYNNFYKFEAGYFLDTDEQFVVFYVE